MQEVTPCLLLNERSEEAVNLYVSVFDNSEIRSLQRYGPHMPLPEGSVLSIDFTIKGQSFLALNGPVYPFTGAVSFIIKADTQYEIDKYYDGLAEGGEAMPCGWVKDKFGVTWQIIWPEMMKLISGADRAAGQRTMKAMMKMMKLSIADLQAAYNHV